MSAHDVIIVPGGGVRAGGQLPPWVQNRIDYVLAHHNGEAVLCLSAGTTHRPPPLDDDGFPIFESVAGVQYLAHHGVSTELLYTETCSYDTIGNAYFARVIHTDVRGWRKLHVVTSAFHMPRTEFIFRWVFDLPLKQGYELTFTAVPDIGMPEDMISARRQREASSLFRVRALSESITDMQALHTWLHTQHGAYAVNHHPLRADKTVSGSY